MSTRKCHLFVSKPKPFCVSLTTATIITPRAAHCDNTQAMKAQETFSYNLLCECFVVKLLQRPNKHSTCNGYFDSGPSMVSL